MISLPPKKEYLTEFLAGMRLRHRKSALAAKIEEFGLQRIKEHQKETQQKQQFDKDQQNEAQQKELLKKATRWA